MPLPAEMRTNSASKEPDGATLDNVKQRVEPARSESILARALAEVAGSALVLDRDLRVVLATPEAEALLGASIKPGTPAVKVLCANSPKRELAEALLAGRSISAVIPHPHRAGKTRSLRVRAIAMSDAAAASGDAQRFRDALATTHGNKNAAAKLLGMSRVTLWRRLRALGIIG